MTDENDTLIKNDISSSAGGVGVGLGGIGASIGTAICLSRNNNAINETTASNFEGGKSGSGVSVMGNSGGVRIKCEPGVMCDVTEQNSNKIIQDSGGTLTTRSIKEEACGSSSSSSTMGLRIKSEPGMVVGGTEHSGSNKTTHDSSGPLVSNNSPDIRSTIPGVGGRLQFFKDGKFILELARAQGEKTGWVSVPRKTFWPPSVPSTTTVTYAKNESSTSLSFSDDNSSIQSSPWQRDHCWKQTSPRRNISKEMVMYFSRTKKFILSHEGYKTAQIKRRRPYDSTVCKTPFTLVKNGLLSPENNGEKNVKDLSSNDGKKYCRKITKSRPKLNAILQRLIDKMPVGLFLLSKSATPSGIINHFSSTPIRISELQHHQQHVSPRKRILRELEKVSLEDGHNKRSRPKTNSNVSTSVAPTLGSSSQLSGNQSIGSSCQTSSTISISSRQVTNGSSNDTNVISPPTSTRYSSYSIHSLLGNSNSSNEYKSDFSNTPSAKDINDSVYLRTMLASPKSPESCNRAARSTQTTNSGKKKSPTYSLMQDQYSHSRSPSSTEPPSVNYGQVRSPEVNLSPEHNYNRYKGFNSTVMSSSGFHPYMSSAKYSPTNAVPLCTSAENYKLKTGSGTPSSPNHHIRTSASSKSPSLSAFPNSTQTNKGSPSSSSSSSLNISTSTNYCQLRGSSPSENLSPSSERQREGTPKTVPKKTSAIRHQFSSFPSSQGGDSSHSYKQSAEQKRKNGDERVISPESVAYHAALDMDHTILRSPSVMPTSPLYYLYPSHGSPGPHPSSSTYMPPVAYYHSPYAAAVAALRNPLWMHYPTGVIPSPGPPSRLTPSVLSYNGGSGGLGPPQPVSLPSSHLPPGSTNAWTSVNQRTMPTEDPIPLVNIKEEPNSDVPLNLSKH